MRKIRPLAEFPDRYLKRPPEEFSALQDWKHILTGLLIILSPFIMLGLLIWAILASLIH